MSGSYQDHSSGLDQAVSPASSPSRVSPPASRGAGLATASDGDDGFGILLLPAGCRPQPLGGLGSRLLVTTSKAKHQCLWVLGSWPQLPSGELGPQPLLPLLAPAGLPLLSICPFQATSAGLHLCSFSTPILSLFIANQLAYHSPSPAQQDHLKYSPA